MAGNIPNTTPTKALNEKLMMIAHKGTWASSRFELGSLVRPKAKSSPISTPTSPPARHKTTASRRNCRRIALNKGLKTFPYEFALVFI